jgi:hypothetical protein
LVGGFVTALDLATGGNFDFGLSISTAVTGLVQGEDTDEPNNLPKFF